MNTDHLLYLCVNEANMRACISSTGKNTGSDLVWLICNTGEHVYHFLYLGWDLACFLLLVSCLSFLHWCNIQNLDIPVAKTFIAAEIFFVEEKVQLLKLEQQYQPITKRQLHILLEETSFSNVEYHFVFWPVDKCCLLGWRMIPFLLFPSCLAAVSSTSAEFLLLFSANPHIAAAAWQQMLLQITVLYLFVLESILLLAQGLDWTMGFCIFAKGTQYWQHFQLMPPSFPFSFPLFGKLRSFILPAIEEWKTSLSRLTEYWIRCTAVCHGGMFLPYFCFSPELKRPSECI